MTENRGVNYAFAFIFAKFSKNSEADFLVTKKRVLKATSDNL